MSEALRLLLVAWAYPPVQSTGSQRPERFVRFLRESNIASTVITFSEPGTASTSEVVRTPPSRPSLRARSWSAAGRAAERILPPHWDGCAWAPHAIDAALVHGAAVDAVLSTSPPMATHLAASVIRRRLRVPWLADFRDPFADNPFRTGHVLGSRRLADLWDSEAERIVMASADHIIANTDTALALWQRRYPQWSEKMSLIWNGYDPDETLPGPSADAREPAKRTLAHIGNIYGPRHPGLLVESLARLISTGRLRAQSVEVKLVGSLAANSSVWANPAFEALRHSGVLALQDARPRLEALQIAADADYLLVLDVNQDNANFQVPAKLFEYVRLGKPILAFTPDASPVMRLLARSGIPHRCISPRSSPDTIDAGVMGILAAPAGISTPSPWFTEQFDGRRQVLALASLVRRVVSERRQHRG